MWDLIVSVPDHCLSFALFSHCHYLLTDPRINGDKNFINLVQNETECPC